MEKTVLIMQYEIYLTEFRKMAAVWERLLGDLLKEIRCYHVFGIFSQGRVNEFDLGTDNVVEAHQKNMLYFSDIRWLKVLQELLCVFDVTRVKERSEFLSVFNLASDEFFLACLDLLDLIQFVEGLQTGDQLFQIVFARIVVNIFDLLLIFSDVPIRRFECLMGQF